MCRYNQVPAARILSAPKQGLGMGVNLREAHAKRAGMPKRPGPPSRAIVGGAAPYTPALLVVICAQIATLPVGANELLHLQQAVAEIVLAFEHNPVPSLSRLRGRELHQSA